MKSRYRNSLAIMLVRIRTMRPSFPLLCASLILHLPMPGAQDPRVTEAMYRVSREASQLWQIAPGFMGRETLNQKALAHKRSRFRVGVDADAGALEPMYQTREILSFYGLGAFKGSPEALREFRETYAMDGAPVEPEKTAREKLAALLSVADNPAKQAAIAEFDKRCVAGSATDFGQLILLFTKTNVDKYTYDFGGDARLGVDNAWIVPFKQQKGSESLHISDAGKKIAEKLQGEIWVRQGDYLPLRVVLNSTRKHNKDEVRDEAKVDYTVVSGALLPAAIVYRRFLNDELVLESIYRYSDWQPLAAK
jgi:hypothetical protein